MDDGGHRRRFDNKKYLTFESKPNASFVMRLVILSKWTDSVRPSLLITCILIILIDKSISVVVVVYDEFAQVVNY
jgi:hypothetical protein